MIKKKLKTIGVFWVVVLVALLLVCPMLWADDDDDDDDDGPRLRFTNVYVKTYAGGADGGLAHVTYWSPALDVSELPPEEQAKVSKIRANVIHANAFQPTNANIAGTEVTGLLKIGKREQSITFRLPDPWNDKLVVGGTPGLRNEYANEAILVPWLLEAGYAYISGDKRESPAGPAT